MKLTNELINAFNKNIKKGVNETDCWSWKSGKQKQGYGTITVRDPDKRTLYAHRVSFAIHFDLIDSLDVMHSCDNPECANPKHLSQGTHFDNMKDKTEKGRNNNPIGIKHHEAKLTEEQVKIIYAGKLGSSQVFADRYGVDRGAINSIWTKKTWVHITDELDKQADAHRLSLLFRLKNIKA